MAEREKPDPSKPLPPIADNAKEILEQYKAYLGDLGNIGTRYTTANGFFLSAITALLAILALTKKGESYSELRSLEWVIPIFAILICWVWSGTIRFYKDLFLVKFDILRELEKLGGLHNVFKREEQEFSPRPWLLKRERVIPWVLAVPFAFILAERLWRFAMCGG